MPRSYKVGLTCVEFVPLQITHQILQLLSSGSLSRLLKHSSTFDSPSNHSTPNLVSVSTCLACPQAQALAHHLAPPLLPKEPHCTPAASSWLLQASCPSRFVVKASDDPSTSPPTFQAPCFTRCMPLGKLSHLKPQFPHLKYGQRYPSPRIILWIE